MKSAIVVLFLLLITGACTKEDIPSDTPACIKEKIEQMKKDAVTNPPREVWQYTFNNQTVYYIPPMCCDVFSELYDAQCNLICHPDGGITGMGDGKCPDFFEKRKNEKLIWRDDRK
ncbi:hypothetical protein DR864_18150 [Runella rosea]|uniref:DUF6970 domain-containing protein n=1 Tax=Runella rosea TaxID=2259595 RepID=A0A344TLK1_9BACT|nr:hypothetical protein [Runella rosea]AXE19522.1 hypothetical protein DR864_18150 [Runella rosea]